MRQRLPLGLLLLGAVALLATLLGAAGTIFVAVERAQQQFDALLDEKALSRAFRIKRDVELAVDLGIPLAEIRGMWEYTAQIPEADPDIRFVVISDRNLQRLHYGGIGRRRLDPLLADPVLEAAAEETLDGETAAADAVTLDGFSITTLPLLDRNRPVGFVHVAVQRKQLRERLFGHIGEAVPLTLLSFLLVLELTGFAYAAGYREPLQRLARLLEAAARSDGRRFELSGRHAGGAVGATMLCFNALMHRLSRRAGRFLSHADEVRRAVFEPAVAAQVAALIESAELGTSGGQAPLLVRRLDARRSDMRPALVLGLAIAAAVPASFAGLAEWGSALAAAAAAGLGIAAGLLALAPGISLLAALALVALSALLAATLAGGAATLAAWLLLAAAGGLLAGLAGRYARLHALRPGALWLAARLATGVAAGLLGAASVAWYGAPGAVAVCGGLAVIVGALSMLLRSAVRRLAFASAGSVTEQRSEAV